MDTTAASGFSERRFEGLTVVVTGAAHRIGRFYAKRLGVEGANEVVADLDALSSETLCQELEHLGIGALAVHTDVADEPSVAA